MPTFSLFNRWRWQGIHLATRHAIVFIMFGLTIAGSLLGSSLLGAFAHAPCQRGDRVYTVSWGNTLGAIAARYGTSWQRLASYNHLGNPNLIYPGQGICIPSGSTSTNSGSGSGSSPWQPGPTLSHNQYVNIARQDAASVGFSPDIFVRQINAESGFNPYAYSPAGAIGIAQFMPGTAAWLGINPRNPVDSLRGAARLMSSYLRQYGGNYAKALAAYNGGPGTVATAVFVGGWNWQAYLPYETRNYIRIILG